MKQLFFFLIIWSEPRIHEIQEAVLYVYTYICNFERTMVVMGMRIRLHALHHQSEQDLRASLSNN